MINGEKKQKNTTTHYPEQTEAYAHPNGPNLQITPYKGPHRTEFDIRTFLVEEPKTKQQKRKEELALGIF